MNHFKINHHFRELGKLVIESFKSGNISADQAKKKLYQLEVFAYQAFPNLVPDGDVTLSLAMLIRELEELEQ